VRSGFVRRTLRRTTTTAGTLFILGLFLLAGGSAVMYATVHHTAQPQFCNSCHIMEPYYQSWVDSAHADVSCIECHYEPGTVETLEGKFKALSQLAKYVTRTQGTKPWAEVSDASCMRSGCHSVRMLEGPVTFGDIKFDHRHHLLESRRGRRLRCVSCHSQIVQGEHVSVTSSVCITCHFMPDEHGLVPEKSSDCLTCHGPPDEAVLVGDRPFVHADYIERGVDCRACHDPVIEGDGTVRKERCHSCHAEVGHIERLGETDFLHEKHVTDHKVECFECHDEIHHGLMPLERPRAAESEGCGSCHASTHEAASLLLAGTGAAGVPDQPSRMYETRVGCAACHTGRSGYRVRAPLAAHASDGAAGVDGAHRFVLSGAPADGAHSASIAAAGNVDCIHCHGPSYDGMLGEWQATVGEQLERLKPLLGELEERLGETDDGPASTALAEARRNLSLVAFDGSRGAHNVDYALDVLRAGAERIDAARGLLGVEGDALATADLPFSSAEGCTACHAGAGRPAEVWPGEAAFPHARHLASGMECSACHGTAAPGTLAHGAPSFPRTNCASCHHQESEAFDANDCTTCHSAQASVQTGGLADLIERPGPMSAMECWECHGEAPTVLRPKPATCVLCHEPGYDQMQLDWQATIDGLMAQLGEKLAAAESAGLSGAALETARAALDAVRRDGSRGAHNFELCRDLLGEALAGLEGN
jgi:nitrate/TMAO reductase-like tetraheme cytochrome c subunit